MPPPSSATTGITVKNIDTKTDNIVFIFTSTKSCFELVSHFNFYSTPYPSQHRKTIKRANKKPHPKAGLIYPLDIFNNLESFYDVSLNPIVLFSWLILTFRLLIGFFNDFSFQNFN